MFEYTYKIKKEDINGGNHSGNERALLFFQWARDKFLEKYSLSQLNVGDGVGLIQLNAYLEYKEQLFLNDTINIEILKIEVEGLKLKFYYKVEKNKKEVIVGYTTLACYDYNLQKIKRIPKIFMEIISSVS